MRILHALAGGAFGGAETFSTELILALANAGAEQLVLTRPHAARLARFDAGGVAYRTFGFGRIESALRGRARLRRLIAEYRPDVVQSWMSRAASIMPATDTPTLGWMGGYYDPKRFGACDHIVTCTEDIRRFVVEEKGRDGGRVHHINTFALLEDTPAVGRADFGLADRAVVLLSLSRLHEKKGIDVLLEALAGLDERYVLLIAGEGELRAEFEALSQRLGVADRVRFLGWRTDRRALLDLADICVLPSRYEPFGTVVVEAWQTRTPIIAARATGPANSIAHGIDGLLCGIDDAAGLRAQIEACQADPARRAAMIEAGLENVRRTYNEAAVAGKFLALYEGIVAGR